MTAPTPRPDVPTVPTHDDALLAVRDLTVTYGGDRGPQAALESVSFAIAPGQSYGLVGESGCGKSTVALAVMRYLPRNGRIAGGQILLEGQDLATLSGERLRGVRGNRLAMVYQDPGSSLNPAMRIGEQLAEVYRNHGRLARPAALDASRQMLDKVQMRDPGSVMTRYPHQLSGGMQQRVVIAMALAANPALLILDEPTTGLDATVEAAVLDLVGDLRRELGTAILFISHNLAVVARLCERIGVLYAGRLVEEGPTRDVFYAPRHPYTLGLLGCVPRFGVRKGSTRLLPIPGQMPRPGARGPGCRFMARCAYARDRCREEPPLLQPASGRGTRCWFWDELPATAAAYIGALADGEGPKPAAGAAQQSRPTLNTSDPQAGPTLTMPVVPVRAGDAIATDPWRSVPVLALDHLGKTFPSQGGPAVRAVQDVSLQVGRGRTFGLVGESGSGKSTLARVVAGLLPASSGQVSLDGSDVTVVAQRRSRQTLQRLQMVFQSPEATLNPSERIGTTLARSVRALGGLRGEALRQRVLALAAAVNIDSTLLESYPRQLSGGQRQRVAIARAFAGDPELVLCDEPASALDVSVQAAILNLLVDIQERQGASYIFISHDLTVVRYLADDIGVMYLGRLVEVGPAERVFAPPFHPYTEMLFAAIPTLDFDRPPAATDVTAPPPVGEVQRMPQQAADGPQPVVGEVLAPGGCPFRLRCPRLLGPQCAEEPPWRETADGHRYLCWIPAETLTVDQRALGTRP